ncbi:MAG: DUF493 domain-containing protein [Campylobacteraceae bacterium]|jgi:putative lipoic acid-binding regulatory protein|nr:DUF493 domain-containing protein [Campylobacteraceae bacterium]
MADDINSKELALDYPCTWRYKVIIAASGDIKAVVKRVLKEREHTLKFSHKSQKGGYESYNLEVLVFDAGDRAALYEALQADADVKFIL